MKLVEHYLHLQKALSNTEAHMTHKITIKELSDLLCCTPRHTKHVLKQLEERKWIHWNIVRGRGKRSTLTFLLTHDEVIKERAQQLVRDGKYTQAMEQLSSAGLTLKEQFHDWLQGQLGYSVEMKDQKEIDILRYPYFNIIKNLDPIHYLSRHEAHITDHLFDTLLKYDMDTQELRPHIAHHWEVHNEGSIWTFYLRKGIKFHHGREMTANDIVETFRRLKLRNKQNLWMYKIIKEIRVLRSTVVQFILSQKNYLFPYYVSHYHASIIPVEVWKKNPDKFTILPVGTGPLKIVKHNNTMMVLEVFKEYFQGRAHLDRIEILTLPDLHPKNDQLINYWKGMGHQNPNDHWQKLKQVQSGASYISFNLNIEGPQQNDLFRKAISLSLDLELMTQEIGDKNYIPAQSLLPEQTEILDKPIYDPDYAIHLLKNSGYNGETIRIFATEITEHLDQSHKARWIQSKLKEVGLNSVVEVIPVEKLVQPDYLQQPNMIVCGVTLSQNIILSMMNTFQAPAAFILNMVDPHWAKMINEKMMLVKTKAEKDNQLKVLLDLEYDLRESYQVIFLHHRIHSININENSPLAGVSLNWSGRVNYKDLWLKNSISTIKYTKKGAST
jgi:SgrR family transcriptional regulator